MYIVCVLQGARACITEVDIIFSEFWKLQRHKVSWTNATLSYQSENKQHVLFKELGYLHM